MSIKIKQKIATFAFIFILVFLPFDVFAETECYCANSHEETGDIVLRGKIENISDKLACEKACNETTDYDSFYFCFPSSKKDDCKEITTSFQSIASDNDTSGSKTTSGNSNKKPLIYTPMEEIPGFGRPNSYAAYIMAIYKFGLWTVGISAVFMISIGAFMYITSAGNTSSTKKAKEIIFDAIAGVILALTSYILLYTINPALVQLNNPSYDGGDTTSRGSSETGKCEPVTSGPCSIENLKKTCFGANAEKASAICMGESGGRESLVSGDKCQPDNFPISLGLFQINLSAHNLTGNSCSQKNCAASAATPLYTGSNHNCTKGENYETCLASATNPSCNIETACKISNNGANWGQWSANKKCGFPR